MGSDESVPDEGLGGWMGKMKTWVRRGYKPCKSSHLLAQEGRRETLNKPSV